MVSKTLPLKITRCKCLIKVKQLSLNHTKLLSSQLDINSTVLLNCGLKITFHLSSKM